MTSPYAGCRNPIEILGAIVKEVSGERRPEGASPAAVPSANAASAASPRRPTDLRALSAALASGNTELAAAIIFGGRT